MHFHLFTPILSIFRKFVVSILTIALAFGSFPFGVFKAPPARAATMSIRQEINILDQYDYAPSDAYATSSEIVLFDPDKYASESLYFEVVASTTGATNANVHLVNASTGAIVDTLLIDGGNTYARYRSASPITLPGAATEYTVKLGNESIGKGVIAARLIVLQSGDITATETQIEIGNSETAKSNTSTDALTSPKYWYYDNTKWDGITNAYAEVTYKIGPQAASTTVYNGATTTHSTYTYIESPGVTYITVEAWGAGGGGRNTTSNAGGAGGGGGAYARSTTTPTGLSHTLSIPPGGAAGSTTVPARTRFDSTVVVAASGLGNSGATSVSGGTTGDSTGQVTYAGGASGAADGGNDTGGGGGGAAGPNAIGTVGATPAASATLGATGGSGVSGAGGAGGAGGNNATCNPSGNGQSGKADTAGGGGGGGSDTTCQGGPGGRPGGGGGGGDTTGTNATGAPGQVRIKETHGEVGIALEEDNGSFGGWTFVNQIVNGGSSTSTPVRVRSVSFAPTNGHNYRIVASTTDASVTYNIYNAKIIVQQTNPTLLESQYLLANTLVNGTGLKNYDTLYNSAEWSGVTNTYIHEIDSSTDSADSASLQSDPNGTPSTMSNSTATGANRARGTAMTMPSGTVAQRTIDVNVLDVPIYASRILVQVGPPQLSFSGTLYGIDETTAVTTGKTIKLAIGTSTPGVFTTTSDVSGNWSIGNIGLTSAFLGERFLAWTPGEGTSTAITFTKASSTANSIPKIDLYQNRVTIKHEGFTGTSTTNADLDFYDADQDTDIPLRVTSGALAVNKSKELHISPGTEFAPGGAVTLHGNASTTNPDGDIHLATGLRQDGTATSSILTMGANALTLVGNWFASSTAIFTHTGTVTFNSTSTGQQKNIIATSTPFSTLTFNGSGGSWTFGANAATSTGNLTITAGAVTAPSTYLYLGGDFSRSGTFTHNSGTTTFYKTSGAQSISSAMTNGNGFNNVEFTGSGTKSFGANSASTTNFIIDSASGAVTAPSTLLTISGNYTNNGDFTDNGGTVYFSGSGITLSGTMNTSATDFSHVEFTGSGTKTFSSNASTTNFIINNNQTVYTTYTTAGSDTFVVPSGITSVVVKAWGAGGGGGSRTVGGAGGGGGFGQATISVTPGETLDVLVGAPGIFGDGGSGSPGSPGGSPGGGTGGSADGGGSGGGGAG